jgi:hypothetical protein
MWPLADRRPDSSHVSLRGAAVAGSGGLVVEADEPFVARSEEVVVGHRGAGGVETERDRLMTGAGERVLGEGDVVDVLQLDGLRLSRGSRSSYR